MSDAERIAALERELADMKRYYRKPTHGPCCTCQRCGQHYDDCRCDLDDLAAEWEQQKQRITRLEAINKQLVAALEIAISPIQHIDGCLWKADHSMPCQCGWNDRLNAAMNKMRAALAAAKEQDNA